MKIERAHQILTIGTADMENARALGISLESPVANVRRIICGKERKIICLADSAYRADFVKLDIELKYPWRIVRIAPFNFGFEASSFFTADGPPPGVGQLLVAMAPGPLSDGRFEDRLALLLGAVLVQENTRLPGDRRLNARRRALSEGLSVDDSLLAQIRSLVGAA